MRSIRRFLASGITSRHRADGTCSPPSPSARCEVED